MSKLLLALVSMSASAKDIEKELLQEKIDVLTTLEQTSELENEIMEIFKKTMKSEFIEHKKQAQNGVTVSDEERLRKISASLVTATMELEVIKKLPEENKEEIKDKIKKGINESISKEGGGRALKGGRQLLVISLSIGLTAAVGAIMAALTTPLVVTGVVLGVTEGKKATRKSQRCDFLDVGREIVMDNKLVLESECLDDTDDGKLAKGASCKVECNALHEKRYIGADGSIKCGDDNQLEVNKPTCKES